MLSFNRHTIGRRTLLISLAALSLSACGFTPVLKQGSAARALQGQIRFNLIESRDGFLLLDKLEARFGTPAASARYAAKVDLMIDESRLTLTAATSVERITLNGTAMISVVDTATDSEVFNGKLRQTTSYTSTGETAQTVASKREAHAKLVTSLADQIVMRLNSSAESWAK